MVTNGLIGRSAVAKPMSRGVKLAVGAFFGLPAALALAGSAMYALQPTSYSVQRSRTIATPPAAVAAKVTDFAAYTEWEPWLGPAGSSPPTVTVSPVTTGPGASLDTTNMAEHARYTFVSVAPLRIELARSVSGGVSSRQVFDLRPVAAGTEVTWTHAAPVGAGLPRLLYPFVNLDSMVGSGLERGLARLDVAVSRGAP